MWFQGSFKPGFKLGGFRVVLNRVSGVKGGGQVAVPTLGLGEVGQVTRGVRTGSVRCRGDRQGPQRMGRHCADRET